MALRKVLLYLGLLLAPLSGGAIYYLYQLQTKEITILQIRANLDHEVVPGMRITSDLFETKVVMQKDLPIDHMPPGSVGNNVYASKYLYPSDPLVSSKVSDKMIAYKEVDQRIVSIKPTGMGLMGLIQLDDRITIVTPTFSISSVRVIGTTDAGGGILSIIPQFSKSGDSGGYLQSITNTAQVSKGADQLLLLVTKEDADILSKLAKESVTIVFESRPSLMETK